MRSASRPGRSAASLQRGDSVTLPDGRTITPDAVLGPARAGRKLVLSGDTDAGRRPCSRSRIAADLLVHEATFGEDEAERARETMHSTAREAAELAREAEVKMLALTHLSNRYFGPELAREARAVFAETVVPKDFDIIELRFEERGGPLLVKGGALGRQAEDDRRRRPCRQSRGARHDADGSGCDRGRRDRGRGARGDPARGRDRIGARAGRRPPPECDGRRSDEGARAGAARSKPPRRRSRRCPSRMSSSPTPSAGGLLGRTQPPRYDEPPRNHRRSAGTELRRPARADEGDLRAAAVLDVARLADTGRLATPCWSSAYGCKVWGVDPEPEMIEVARGQVPAGVGLKIGRAEDLPFKDGWFERVTMTLVLQFVDRPARLCRSDSRPAAGRPPRARDVRLRAFRAVLPRRLLPLVRGASTKSASPRPPSSSRSSAPPVSARFAHSPDSARDRRSRHGARAHPRQAHLDLPADLRRTSTGRARTGGARAPGGSRERAGVDRRDRPSGKRRLVPAQLCLDRRFVLPLVAPARMYTSTAPSVSPDRSGSAVSKTVRGASELVSLDGLEARRYRRRPLRPECGRRAGCVLPLVAPDAHVDVRRPVAVCLREAAPPSRRRSTG